jgi:glycosyltransferase involved in cell wall biosynthesis
VARRRHICFTFIGDITRDSRCSRMIAGLAKNHEVSLISLYDRDARFEHAGGYVLQSGHAAGQALRRRLTGFWKAGQRLGDEHEADLYIASDLYSLPLAARLASQHGAQLIYDSRELYSDVAALQGRSLTQQFWNIAEKRYAGRAAAILTVNNSIAAILQARYPRVPVRVIRNLPERIPVMKDRAILRDALDLDPGRFVLLSQGGLQRGRGAEQYVRIMRRIDDAVLVFLGDGPLRADLESAVQLGGIGDRVRFAGTVPWDVLPEFTAGADIGLCMIENLGRSYHLSLPNKLFEYIVAGVPVVASDFPELSRVVHDYAVGVTADPQSDDDVFSAIRSLIDDSSEREACRAACIAAAEELHWGKEEPAFNELIAGVLGD